MLRPSFPLLVLSLVLLGSCKGASHVVPVQPDQPAPVVQVEGPSVEAAGEVITKIVLEPVAQVAHGSEQTVFGPWHSGTSPKGLFEVSWRLVGVESIEVNEHFEIELMLTRLDGNERIPWEGADPDVHARMPEHRHGMLTRPVPIEMGEGHYRIPAMLFHMEGYWVLRVTVRTGDGVADIERAAFDINIK